MVTIRSRVGEKVALDGRTITDILDRADEKQIFK